MPKFRIIEAAEILGVSDDTVRRWIDNGQLLVERDQSCRMVIDGAGKVTAQVEQPNRGQRQGLQRTAKPVVVKGVSQLQRR